MSIVCKIHDWRHLWELNETNLYIYIYPTCTLKPLSLFVNTVYNPLPIHVHLNRYL